MVDAFLDWLTALPPGAVYPVLMVASALENIFPPVPADVAVALGAWISQRGPISTPLLGIACWLANCASAVGVYALGRSYGESLVRRRWARALMPPEVLREIAGAYDRHGVAGIFWSRFLPGLRAGVMPFAGIVRMPAHRAIPPALAASALWYAALVSVGSALGLGWEEVKGLVESANRALAVVAVLALAAFALWLRRRSKLRAEPPRAGPGP